MGRIILLDNDLLTFKNEKDLYGQIFFAKKSICQSKDSFIPIRAILGNFRSFLKCFCYTFVINRRVKKYFCELCYSFEIELIGGFLGNLEGIFFCPKFVLSITNIPITRHLQKTSYLEQRQKMNYLV